MNKKLMALFAAVLIFAATVAIFQLSGSGTRILWEISDSGQWLLPLVLVAALLDSINPCAFSILILTIAFLFSIGRMRSDIFKIGGAYILGVFAVYLLIGLGILQALHLFGTPHFMARLGASLLIVLGAVNVVNDLFPFFPIKLRIPHVSHGVLARLMEKGSLPTAFILGVLVGLCEFPCTGGPYLMILGLLYDQATRWSGFGYLVLYNLIFLLPLVLILLIAGNESLLGKVEEWKKRNTRRMKLWSGIAMIAFGWLILAL